MKFSAIPCIYQECLQKPNLNPLSKKLALFIFFASLASPLFPAENTLIEKTGQAIGSVAQKIAEPIRDPKAAISTWFDFNPRIESGEKTDYNVLPLFVSSPERGQGFGVKYAQASLLKRNDVLRIQAIQTLKNKSGYELRYELPPNLVSVLSRFGGEFEIAYENYAQFYYGIGNETKKEDESQFTPEFFTLKVPLLFGITERVSAGVSLNYENWSMTETGTSGILPKDLPNLIGKNGSKLYTSGFLLRWDSRNSKTDPSKGLLLEGDMEYSKRLFGSETDFTRATFETRGFYPLFPGNERHVFGVRFFLDYTNGDVPFYHLPQLGGIFFNRGLIEGRFRDSLSLTGNWEYRLKIYNRLHWAFFVDAGNVFHEFKETTFRDTKITGGTGMRYYVPPGDLLLARIDGGLSTEGFQVYLTFDQPF